MGHFGLINPLHRMAIFIIFVRDEIPYFWKQPSECLSRQSVETEGMEDGRKLAY